MDLATFDRCSASDEALALHQASALYRGRRYGWDNPGSKWIGRGGRNLSCVRCDAWRLPDAPARPCGRGGGPARYLRLHPKDEQAWFDLMNAHWLCGNRLQALEVFDRCGDFLQRTYQLEPPIAMKELYRLIRDSDLSAPGSVLEEAEAPAGGVVPLRSGLYVERPADTLFREAIARREGIIVVKGPCQTGKSSLLARGLQEARTQGAVTIVTNFDTFAEEDLRSLDTLCRRVAASWPRSWTFRSHRNATGRTTWARRTT